MADIKGLAPIEIRKQENYKILMTECKEDVILVKEGVDLLYRLNAFITKNIKFKENLQKINFLIFIKILNLITTIWNNLLLEGNYAPIFILVRSVFEHTNLMRRFILDSQGLKDWIRYCENDQKEELILYFNDKKNRNIVTNAKAVSKLIKSSNIAYSRNKLREDLEEYYSVLSQYTHPELKTLSIYNNSKNSKVILPSTLPIFEKKKLEDCLRVVKFSIIITFKAAIETFKGNLKKKPIAKDLMNYQDKFYKSLGVLIQTKP